MSNALIERQIMGELRSHLSQKEITLVLGPRQSGKTTLLKLLEEELKTSGKKTLFLNLDILADKEKLGNQTELIAFLKNLSTREKVYVFIDEVQRIDNAGWFMKGVYDSALNCKFILSGSSSLEIKTQISEPLTGRKQTFFLPTLTFSELVSFKEPEINNLLPLKDSYQKKMLYLLDEYLRFGGYPRVVKESNPQQKIKYLEEIYSSYIEKDIELFFQVRNKSSFLKMVAILASEMGGILNKDGLSSLVGSNRTTVDNFLHYLKASFVLRILPPFFQRPRKELIKSPKIYFSDLGLRNLLIKNFASFKDRQDKGVLLENFILNELLNILDPVTKINYWRSRTGAEIDFVISRGKMVFLGMEIKAHFLRQPEYSLSFRSFLQIYQPKAAFIVNLGLEKRQKINNISVHTIPFFRLDQVRKLLREN